jgi:hypothetical protein
MFEDFKEKIYMHDSKKAEPQSLPPEVIAKLKSQGLDPETVTMKQLFPETIDKGGNDLSLMSAAEMEIMITYGKTRKYLIEKYPQIDLAPAQTGQIIIPIAMAGANFPFCVFVLFLMVNACFIIKLLTSKEPKQNTSENNAKP